MRVPEDHEVGGREAPAQPGGAALPLPAVVDHADAHALQLDLEGLGGTPLGDLGHVVVAHDDVHRRERREQVEDVGRADVAGVQDDVGGLEVREQRRRAGLPAARRVGVGERRGPSRPHALEDLADRGLDQLRPCSRSRAAGCALGLAVARGRRRPCRRRACDPVSSSSTASSRKGTGATPPIATAHDVTVPASSRTTRHTASTSGHSASNRLIERK